MLTMNHVSLLPAVILASLLSLLSLAGFSQGPASGATTVVRVKNLDAATRDALTTELAQGAGPRVVYACVPAGILVFEQPGAAEATVRGRSLTALEKHVRSKDITVLPMDRAAAEQQCAQARSRR